MNGQSGNSAVLRLKGAANYLWREGTVWIILLALIILFSVLNPVFFSAKNLYNLVTQSTYFIIAGMAIAFVMMTGGIDLSVGYQMALISSSSAILMQTLGVPVWAVFVWAIVLGVVLGSINGVISAKLRLFPLIVTIATSEMFKGIAYTVTNAKTFSGMSESFRALYKVKLLGLPLDVFLAVFIVALTWFVLNKTHFGRDILAVGGNAECARLSGINSDRIQILCFAITGAGFGIASLDMMAQQNMTSATTGPGTEFTCLTAAIIGGVSMMGGKGNVFGLVAGIFVMQIISTGMQLAGWGTYLQYAVKGIILIVAIAFDALKNRPRIMARIHSRKQKTTEASQC
jgi:ribose/xylose/arabinose/galactoside ABC-type transport system permease subunit